MILFALWGKHGTTNYIFDGVWNWRRAWDEDGHLCERGGLRASPTNRRADYAKGGLRHEIPKVHSEVAVSDR